MENIGPQGKIFILRGQIFILYGNPSSFKYLSYINNIFLHGKIIYPEETIFVLRRQ
jgi:hypothetical protein